MAMARSSPALISMGILLALLIVNADGCRSGRDARSVDIDWRTSPLDLDLRGMIGRSYRFHCPAGKPLPELVTGSGLYTDASSICSAAVHAGALDASHDGVVDIQIQPGQDSYSGNTQNFIRSQSYEQHWGGSFIVLSAVGGEQR